MQNKRFTQDSSEKVASLRPRNFIQWLRRSFNSKKQLGVVVIGAAFLVMLLTAISLTLGSRVARSESYVDVSGAAGLNATISYDCSNACDQKFDFNVYIYKSDGQQSNVVRPDKDGRVNLALAEGNYVMLIGKQFGQSAIFPQEPLTLKNGKTLELKLEYK